MSDSKKTLDNLINSDEVNLSEFEKEDYILDPLIPELNLIEDQGIKFFTRAVLLRAGVFWDMPSSFDDKYCPPDEQSVGGMVIHTKRVVRTVMMLAESYGLTSFERDIVLSAALLHDITKGIEDPEKETFHYDIMYPYTIDKFVASVRSDDQKHALEDQSSTLYIEETTALQILRLIHCHMGPWSPIPETYPQTMLEMLLHIADHVCTKLHYIIDGDDYKLERWII